jgi:Cdc6-like AAA superfamily ATPase
MPEDRTRELRGRKNELQILADLRDSVRVGNSATLLMRGEAGVGKTALLRNLAHHAEADFRIVEIVGAESEMEFAYAGLHQLCSPMLAQTDGLPEPQRLALNVAFGLGEGAAPDRLLLGVATLSLLAEAARDRPLLCLIDDAQWLDDASCEVLGFVARRLAAESVAMVIAMRDRPERGQLAGLPEMAMRARSSRQLCLVGSTNR